MFLVIETMFLVVRWLCLEIWWSILRLPFGERNRRFDAFVERNK